LKSPERSRHNQFNLKRNNSKTKEPSVEGDAMINTTLKEGSNFKIIEEEDKTMDVDRQFQHYENTYRNESEHNQIGNRNRRLKSAKVRNSENRDVSVENKLRGRPASSYGKKQLQHQPAIVLRTSAQLSYYN
jgi:hypothetical protein